MKSTKRKIQKSRLKEAGITLVALVVTIIVLLILAGVTIRLAVGGNGIIGKAQYASNIWANATKNETSIMAQIDQQVADLSNVSGEGNTETTIKVGQEETSLSTVATFALNEGLKEHYGKTTDYKSLEGVDWQLFYDDDINIYLIASDYVPRTMFPREIAMFTDEEDPDGDFAYMGDFEDGYGGSRIVSTPWSAGTESSTITNNPLTNKYLKWVNSSLVETKNYPNMKAVAYMMDTSKWSDFAGSASGAYAMGGPTLEMYVLSYNAKHDTKLGTYPSINNENANEYGYRVKMGEDDWDGYCDGLDTSSDNMWVKTNPEKAYGMYIASPASQGHRFLCSVTPNGGLDDCADGYGGDGFRPVVSIPKSSIV